MSNKKEPYITLLGRGEGRYEEKKSVFIGHAIHCESEAEALQFLAAMRKQYADARHNVYAYLLTEGNLMRYSDDAEPQGTAGLPVLDVLRKSGVTDAAIVVTRYFGGTLLGTGGLVRAYTAAAKAAAEDAKIVTYRSFAEWQLVCDYSDYGRLTAFFPGQGARVDDTVFADTVTLRGAILFSNFQSFVTAVTDLTAARVSVEKTGERFDFE